MMNRIERMLHELCPEGVSLKPLGEEIVVKRGKRLVRRKIPIGMGIGGASLTWVYWEID